MKKSKVIVFVQDGVGGAERMSVLIGKTLFNESYDVVFSLLKRGTKTSIKDFIPDYIRITLIESQNPIGQLFSMVNLIRREKPAAVFSSVFNINNKLLFLKPFFQKIKFVIRCDNYYFTYTRKQQRVLGIAYKKADVIIAQTEEMMDELVNQVGIIPSKIKVLHNPIDIKTIETKLEEEKNPYPNNGMQHFLAVGRFDYQKGYDLLIQAFITACKARNDIDLYILGDTSLNGGAVAEYVRKEASKCGVNDLVHLCGYKSNPYPFIKYADSFVLSSRWEGLPNVLIESLYLGTPVAAYKCIPIIERIVDEGVTGFLAEKENVNALSAAMLDSLKLGRVVSSYKPASMNDFVELFGHKSV